LFDDLFEVQGKRGLRLLGWCAVATRRHDRQQELDVYERMRGGGWG
jgi:hypothetical protein